jgi:type VI protein secretion system component Hcp
MKKLIFTLLMLPILVGAQKQNVYIKLVDAKGTMLKGDVLTKGFENYLNALTLGTTGSNNSIVNFTMNITGASADLKKAITNKEYLMSGQITATQIGSNGIPITVYTIAMEKIKVQSCNENLGCNSEMTTSVSLQPVRIGWTYYQNSIKSGIKTVSNKYGFDAETGGAWTNF